MSEVEKLYQKLKTKEIKPKVEKVLETWACKDKTGGAKT